MSIIQVLVGFGLAAVLSLVLAEMNTNSNKQMGQMRLQFERAAVIQTLQSVISNAQVCEKFINLNAQFGPVVTDQTPIPGTSTQSIKANWFYLDTSHLQGIVEGQAIKNMSLKVDWIRAIKPTLLNMTMPGTEEVYVADLQIKLSPIIPAGSKDKKIDLRSMTVGKVYFVTTNTIANSGKVKSCYGEAAGAYLCPNQNDIQVMSSGSWICSSMSQALGPVCGKGQLIQSNGTSTSCVQLYTTAQGCAGAGQTTMSATCPADQCIVTGSGSSAQTVPVTVNIPSLDITSAGASYVKVVSGVSCSTSSGTGSMPGSTSCSESYVDIPRGAGVSQTSAKSFTAYGTVNVPTSSATVKYKDCNTAACNQGAAHNCTNAKQ